MKKRKQITSDEAQRIGEALHLDWDRIDLEQFRQGLMGEVDEANMDPETGRTYDSVLLSGKLVVAHMQEFPDYFTRLEKLKAEAHKHRAQRR
jgi:hypothetical protein